MAVKSGRTRNSTLVRGKAPGRKVSRRKATDLDLRRTPLQARGQATFERILDATARLLDEVGTEAVTTNLIARAAGVNVATLYQYFPNKQTVLLALFQRQSDQRLAVGESHIVGMGTSSDWPRMLDAAIEAVAELRLTTPGSVALRQAMRSSPDLLEHELRGSVHGAEAIANELLQGGRISQDEARLVARCAIEVLSILLDYWAIESHAKDARIIEQLKVMLHGYLAPYLPARGAGRARRRA